MAFQTIDIGSVPNDGLGDPLRTAFGKVNDNFAQTQLAINFDGRNVIYVSKGDAATDTRGSNSKYSSTVPFATATAAVAAAVSGDTVVVFPGTYTESIVLKDGVNWWFYPVALVRNITSVLTDNGEEVNCSVYGYGVFELFGGNVAQAALKLTGAGTVVIQAKKFFTSSSAAGSAIYAENSICNLYCEEAVSILYDALVVNVDCIITGRIDRLYGYDNAVALEGGNLTLTANKIQGENGSAIFAEDGAGTTSVIIANEISGLLLDDGLALSNPSGANLTIICPKIVGGIQTDGYLRLQNCTVDTSSNSAISPLDIIGGPVILENTTLIAESTKPPVSATTAQDVIVKSAYSNSTVTDSDVTEVGGTITRNANFQ